MAWTVRINTDRLIRQAKESGLHSLLTTAGCAFNMHVAVFEHSHAFIDLHHALIQ